MDLSEYPSKDLCLDHDHKVGHLRSVLCRNCNGIEGKIYNLANRGKRGRSVIEFIRALTTYWESHAAPINPVYHPDHKTSDEKREILNRKARAARVRKQALKNIGK